MASPSTDTQTTRAYDTCVQERTLQVQGLEVEILESTGSSDPVFLFHGNSSSAGSFLPLFETALGKSHKLVAVSLPGHGRSASPPTGAAKESTYSLAGLGKFAAALVSVYGASRYWLVGQSVSGHALLEAIDDFPEAAGLVLLSAPPVSLPQFSQAFRPDPASALIFKPQLSEDDVEQLSSAFVATSDPKLQQQIGHYIRGTDPQFRAMLGASIAQGQVRDECQIFSTTAKPMILIGGTEDRFLNTAYYASVEPTRLWNGAVSLIQGAGHAVQLDAPQQVASIIQEFIGGGDQ